MLAGINEVYEYAKCMSRTPMQRIGKRSHSHKPHVQGVSARFLHGALKISSSTPTRRVSGTSSATERKNSLSESIIYKFVTSEIAFEPPDVQTVRIVQAVNAGQLDREPDLVSLVLLSIPVDGLSDWHI